MSKRITGTTLAVAAIAAALSTSALARGPIELRDVDGDGVVSAEEIRTLAEERRAARLTRYDADGDGELSDAEKDMMREAMRAERLVTADTDGNGELSRAERRAARDARRDMMEAQLDVDGDGVVSDAEGAGFDEIREKRRDGKGRHHGGGERGGERVI